MTIIIYSYKLNLAYDRPIFLGCDILDISNLHMLKFQYGTIRKQLKETRIYSIAILIL